MNARRSITPGSRAFACCRGSMRCFPATGAGRRGDRRTSASASQPASSHRTSGPGSPPPALRASGRSSYRGAPADRGGMPMDRCPMRWIAPLPAWVAMRHPPPSAPAPQEQALQQHPMAKAWATRSRLQIARAAVAPIVAEPPALPAECASHRRAQLRGVRSRPLRARHPRDQRAPSATRESDPVRTATAPGSRRSPRVRDTTVLRAERLLPGCDSRNGRQPVPVPIASMWPDSRWSRCLPGP